MTDFDTRQELDNIIEFLEDYREGGCHGVALGLSGGKDSTVVAMLAKKVWGENVLAILMPNGEQGDIQDSIDIAERLGIKYIIINIGTAYGSLLHNIEWKLVGVERKTFHGDSMWEKEYAENGPKISAQAKTNIPPRLRMTTLYAVAQTLGYRVIGTGNLSEYYIGWCTKFGDMACDLNPLGAYTCTEVVQLGKTLVDEYNLGDEFYNKYIEKTPSDGLCGKTDEEKFGFTYKQLDNYIRGINLESIPEEIKQKIDNMREGSLHKKSPPKIAYTNLPTSYLPE